MHAPFLCVALKRQYFSLPVIFKSPLKILLFETKPKYIDSQKKTAMGIVSITSRIFSSF